MSVPDELRRYVPRTDLYDSLELVHYHMPVEQPPATASYIIFKKGNKTYAKNGVYGHIEYEDTDSATVIQNAIDALGGEGGTIYFRNGTYELNMWLYPSAATKTLAFIGETREGVILKAASTPYTAMFCFGYGYGGVNPTVQQLIIKNMTLNGESISYGIDGALIDTESNIQNVLIENVKLYKSWKYGIFLGSGTGFVLIRNCIFDTCGQPTETTHYDQIGGANVTAHIYNCRYMNGAGNFIDIVDPQQCIYAFNKGTSEIGGVYILGDQCAVLFNKLTSNSPTGINKDASTTDVVGPNIIIGNMLTNFAIYRADPSDIILYNGGYKTENSGIATFSGDGSTTTFNISHGLADTPSVYIVNPLTPDANADRTVSADSTNITITFDAAPPSGTDNIKFSWIARV